MNAKRDYAQGETPVAPTELTSEWAPIVDYSSIFPGNRGVNRDGQYDLYDAPIGVKLAVEPCVKSDPILIAETPWEDGGAVCPGHVWQAGGRYHMLYGAYAANSQFSCTCYAVSDDGYNWQRPNLGQVEFNGSTNNNMIADPPAGTPFEDPLAPPDERFKAIGQEGGSFDAETGKRLEHDEYMRRMKQQDLEGPNYKGPRVESRHWISGWTSPDGIRWKRIPEHLADVPSDGGSAARFDPQSNTYFAYIRVGGMGRRAIGLSRTDDFRHWPPADLVLAPDPQDDLDVSFYGGYYFPYPDNPDLHCMLVQIYHQVSDTCDTQIAFSRDWRNWHRPERRPVIALGAPGGGESCMVRAWGGPVELPDGYWALTYNAQSWLHNCRRAVMWPPEIPGEARWARWKPHRFCGVETEDEGRFTIPTATESGTRRSLVGVSVSGQRRSPQLRLNYRCKPGGWVKCELIRAIPSRLHPDAEGVPGFTFAEADRLTGDQLDQVVTWQGRSDITPVGDTLAIRIRMFGAKVFAYSC